MSALWVIYNGLGQWLAYIADLIIGHDPWQAGLIGFSVGWGICPGYMYFLAVFSEWRWPKYAEQFKAFMPGNLFLGVVFGVTSYLAADYRINSDKVALFGEPQWTWVPLGFAIAIVFILSVPDVIGAFKYKEGDIDKYHWRQLVSWTKVWHNIGVYGIYGFLLIRVGVPGLISAPSSVAQLVQGSSRWADVTVNGWINDGLRVVVILALVRWISYLFVDMKHPKHPTGHVRVTFAQWLSGLVIMTGSALAVVYAF